jgi:hypothetical protein
LQERLLLLAMLLLECDELLLRVLSMAGQQRHTSTLSGSHNALQVGALYGLLLWRQLWALRRRGMGVVAWGHLLLRRLRLALLVVVLRLVRSTRGSLRGRRAAVIPDLD